MKTLHIDTVMDHAHPAVVDLSDGVSHCARDRHNPVGKPPNAPTKHGPYEPRTAKEIDFTHMPHAWDTRKPRRHCGGRNHRTVDVHQPDAARPDQTPQPHDGGQPAKRVEKDVAHSAEPLQWRGIDHFNRCAGALE